MNPVIRTAGHGDAEGVLELWRLGRSPAASTPDTPEAIAHLLARDPEALLVAEVDGEVVGTVIAGFDGWRGAIYRLAVHPSHRRQRIGTGLVEEAERRLAEAGAHRISVIAGADDEPALAIWTAAGYRRDGATTRFVKNL